MRIEELGRRLSGWMWVCPIVSVTLAALILMLWGLTWWTAVLIALFLVCPATMIWGAIETRRKLPGPRDDHADRER